MIVPDADHRVAELAVMRPEILDAEVVGRQILKGFIMDVAIALVDDAFLFGTGKSDGILVLPAYAAVQTGTNRVLACGEEAKAMLGRTPDNISVSRVLVEGLIADQHLAEALVRFGLRRLLGRALLIRPRVVVAIRSWEPGKWPAMRMATAGGAREAFLIEAGMATAIGMRLDVQQPEIKAVITVSDDWFEFAVISLAGVLAGANGTIGTHAFVEDIRNHLTLSRQFCPDAVALASQLESAGVNPRTASDVAGWETWTGRSELGRQQTQTVSVDDLTIGMMPSLVRLTERLKSAIRGLSNDQQYQMSRATIHATGSAMRIPGLAQMIAGQLGHSVTPFSSETHPAIEGCKTVMKELHLLKLKPKIL